MMEPILRVVCDEPGGNIVRRITPVALTRGKLKTYWDKLSRFPTLFNQHIVSFEDFVSVFVSENHGALQANGLIWEVDDVGLFFITDIYPAFQATGHFTFWDRRYRGREELVRQMLQYGFEYYGFRRIIAEVPLYSTPTIGFVERVGFVKEGRYRDYTFYQGEWWDVNLYSVLRREILDDGIHEAADQGEAAEVAGNATG